MSSYFGILGSSLICPSTTPDWNACVPAPMKRRDPRIWQIAYSAAHKVITASTVKPASIIAATALGALDETKNFLDTVFDTGFGSPRNFIASVHNSMAGKIALELQIKGPNLTICEGQNSLASAITVLDTLGPDDFPVLVILIDEHIPLLDNLQPSFSPLCNEYLESDWPDGAFALLLDSDNMSCSSKIRAFPPVPRHGSITESIDNIVATNKIDCTGTSAELHSSSYLDPGINAYRMINDNQIRRSIISSYAPASDSVAIIDILKN